MPAGATDDLQPLDRYVFGTMKGIARHKWRTMYDLGDRDKIGKAEMAQLLIAAWEAVGPNVLGKAWEITAPEDRTQEDSDEEEEDYDEEDDIRDDDHHDDNDNDERAYEEDDRNDNNDEEDTSEENDDDWM